MAEKRPKILILDWGFDCDDDFGKRRLYERILEKCEVTTECPDMRSFDNDVDGVILHELRISYGNVLKEARRRGLPVFLHTSSGDNFYIYKKIYSRDDEVKVIIGYEELNNAVLENFGL